MVAQVSEGWVPRKLCPSCRRIKGHDAFASRIDRRKSSDSRGRAFPHYVCKECVSNADSPYRKARKERRHRNASPASRARTMLMRARDRARVIGVPFGDVSELIPLVASALAEGRCHVTGLPIAIAEGKPSASPFSPSIDRLTPKLGYVAGNIRVVCWAFNSMVGTWGDDVAAQVAEAFLAARARKQRESLPELAPIYHSHPSAFPEPFVPC